MRKILLIFIAAAFLTGCIRYSGGETVNKDKEETEEVEKENSKEAAENEMIKEKIIAEQEAHIDILQRVEKITVNQHGAKTNMKKNRIVDLKINDHAGTESAETR